MLMVRLRLIIGVFLLGLLCLNPHPAYSQRLIPGTSEISLYAGQGFRMRSETGRFATGVEYGYLDNIGKTVFGLNWGSHKQRFPMDVVGVSYSPYYDIRKDDVYVSGGWLGCIVKNRRRSVVFWSGLTVFSGIRIYGMRDKVDPLFSSMNHAVEMPFPSTSFIYGFTPQIRFEFFPGRVWSMSAFIKSDIQFIQFFEKDISDEVEIPKERWFFPEIGFNFSYYFTRM